MPETRTGPAPVTIPGIEDLEPVGRGGFGTVYSGWQPSLRRKVAVKVLDASASDGEAAARFQREGMAMGVLSDHPNVVPVYATGTVEDRPYLVMPLLPDGSLADQLATDGALDPAEVLRLGRGLADALSAAHEAGVLHRDIKPANVLRTPYGALQLADFGIARFADTTQTMGGSLMATVAYAAPEVLSGEPASAASDIYSLGATLHAALLGRAPYEAGPDEMPLAMAVRVLGNAAPDLRSAGIPPALAEVIDQAMARDPAERHLSAAALRDALDAVDLERPISARPTAVDDGPPTLAVPAAVPLAALAHTAVEGTVPAVAEDATRVDSAAVATTMAPALVPSRSAPDRRAGTGPPRRSGWVLAGLAILISLLVGVFLLVDGRDDDGDIASPSTTETSDPATPPSTAAPDTVPDTTVATAPATTAPPATSTDVPTSATQAVRDYYATLDAGGIDEGFALLSPGYQQRTGESSYRGFWESIAGVEVLEAESDGLVSAVTLRYTRADGTASTERATVRFIEDAGGALLIDDYETG
ncbi:MAG: protein kinase [Acidimicrobiales bacterium]